MLAAKDEEVAGRQGRDDPRTCSKAQLACEVAGPLAGHVHVPLPAARASPDGPWLARKLRDGDMTATPTLPDFNARRAPLPAKLTNWLNVLLWMLVGTSFSITIIGVTTDILIAIAASKPVRDGRGFWFELLIVAAFFGGIVLVELPLLRLIQSQRFTVLYAGKPRFEILQGPGKQLFKFLLRCTGSTEICFTPEAEELIRKQASYGAVQVEQVYRHQYEKAGFENAGWPSAWDKIRRTECAGVQYGEAILSGRWDMFWLKYYVVIKVVAPLSMIYVTGAFWLLAGVANGRNPLRLVQFALLAGVVISFIIFINYTKSLQIFQILGRDEAQDAAKILGLDEAHLSKGTPANAEMLAVARQIQEATPPDPELEDAIKRYAGKEFYPTITIRPGYIDAIRNEFSRDFLVLGSVRGALLALVLLAQWPIAIVFSHWSSAQLDAWSMKMLVGTVLIPVALVTALGIGFLILSRFRRFAGVLLTGLLLAVVPPLLTYALRGSVGATVLISSIVTAAIGVLPSAIAEVMKQKPNLGRTS